MCYVTATELKKNLSFYLKKSETEDVYITKNGEVISYLGNPKLKAFMELQQLLETVEPSNITDDELKDAIAEGILKK